MTRRTTNGHACRVLRFFVSTVVVCAGCSGPILRPQSPEARIDLPPMPACDLGMAIRLGNVPYLPGTHRVDFSVQGPGGHIYAHVEDSITFEIGQSPLYGTSHVDRGFGAVYTKIGLDLQPVAADAALAAAAPIASVSRRAGPATDG